MAHVQAGTQTDADIQRDVLQELNWDTRVEATDVGVEVDDGVVTLSGTVSSWGKRAAAEEAAHRVRGVLDVRNALVWDVFVPDTRIRSTVADGNVLRNPGVRTVEDKLRIEPSF